MCILEFKSKRVDIKAHATVHCHSGLKPRFLLSLPHFTYVPIHAFFYSSCHHSAAHTLS